jgi:signal transduction histidine kinase
VVEGEQLVPIVSTDGETAAMEDSASVPVQAARRARQSTEVVRVDDLTDTRSAGGSVAESSTTASVQAHDKTAEAPSAEPYRSLLTVPLEGHRVLQLFAVEPGAFTDRDEDVAEMLATHVTTAVERVEAQAEIRRERDRLDEFATVLSHDIRNPLNVAMGSVQVVQDAEAEAAEEYLGTVETALERIRRLVDDMLTLAQEGETVDDPERVSLERIAEEAWANVATGEMTMRVQVQKSVEADRDRLMQVFENLYRNAIEHGGEDVTVIVGGLEGGFFVEDTGPGIPPEQRDSVFESGYSTADEGTGFGLAIVKRIVTAHGWQIAVATGDEGGARFEIAGIRSVTRD